MHAKICTTTECLRNSELRLIWWWVNVTFRNKQRICAMKTLLCRTHLDTKTNLPTRDWRDDFVVRLCNHVCNKRSISAKQSKSTDKLKSIVLNATPKQVITGEGGQDLAADSSKPRWQQLSKLVEMRSCQSRWGSTNKVIEIIEYCWAGWESK